MLSAHYVQAVTPLRGHVSQWAGIVPASDLWLAGECAMRSPLMQNKSSWT